MKHLTTRRIFATAALSAALIATSAAANSNRTMDRNDPGQRLWVGERTSSVSCRGIIDNSASLNVIQKGGSNTRTAIGAPMSNNSCYPNYADNRYYPSNVRYDAQGNVIRYNR